MTQSLIQDLYDMNIVDYEKIGDIIIIDKDYHIISEYLTMPTVVTTVGTKLKLWRK